MPTWLTAGCISELAWCACWELGRTRKFCDTRVCRPALATSAFVCHQLLDCQQLRIRPSRQGSEGHCSFAHRWPGCSCLSILAQRGSHHPRPPPLLRRPRLLWARRSRPSAAPPIPPPRASPTPSATSSRARTPPGASAAPTPRLTPPGCTRPRARKPPPPLARPRVQATSTPCQRRTR